MIRTPMQLEKVLLSRARDIMRLINKAKAELDAYDDDVSTSPRAPEWFVKDPRINAELRMHGVVVDRSRPHENTIVATHGVFEHTDHCGLVALVGLHNDGLKLRSGRRSFTLGIGDIVVFDDRKPHSVVAAGNDGVFVALHLAVIEVTAMN